jgi:hypothetical protein
MTNRAETNVPIPRTGLTPDEASISAGLSRTRIFGLIREGRLVARGAGKATIITPDDLRACINSLPKKGPASAA